MSSRNGQFGSSGQAVASKLNSNAAATGNGFDVPQVSGSVQQSSFDSVTSRPASGLLQPAVAATQPGSGASTDGGPSAYPTTSYGMIRPASRNSSVGSTSPTEIPAHLLQGSSSFSPGSTAQLQPAESAK
jgi:hypothetical protein